MIPAPAHLNPHLTGLVHPAPVFVADFLPVALGFHHRTHRVRHRNLGTTDKKSSHKIRYRKIPREHNTNKEDQDYEISIRHCTQ